MSQPDLRSLQAVVFDFDGTLADTRINFARMRERIIDHLRQWGLYEPGCEEGRYILEIIAWAREKLGPGTDAERYDRESREILEQVEMETCAEAHPFPGVIEALECMRRMGLALGIITRNCRAAVGAVLQRYHIPHDVLLTRDDLERVKPDPEHLLVALRELGVEPHRALMVGDHPTDIQCARAAGATAVGVLTDRTTREDHLAAGADMVLDDVPALARLICERESVQPGRDA